MEAHFQMLSNGKKLEQQDAKNMAYAPLKYNRSFTPIWVFLIGLIIFSCQSDYTKIVNREADRGLRQDTLLFGMTFGYTLQEFYDRCWQLNQEKKVTQGPYTRSVKYEMTSGKSDENGTTITMLFYGTFDRNSIMTGMDMEFSYKAWSLWNKDYEAQKLFPKVRDSLMDWFPGNGFIAVKSGEPIKGTYVKVDGNRQILAYVKDNKDVVVKIEDLRLKYPEKYN